MDTYLDEIENIIKQNFGYVSTWNNEIKVISQSDTTFMITKKNFLIIGLNSINEFLLEEIIRLYYEKYFELLLSETKYNNYCGHELLKVEIIVRRNNDGSYGGFISILEQVLGSIITKSIKKSIKDKFNGKLDNFTNELGRVYELRNKIGHNSQNYFINDKEITFDLTKIEDLIENLQSNFIELSKCFFNEMNTLLNIRI